MAPESGASKPAGWVLPDVVGLARLPLDARLGEPVWRDGTRGYKAVHDFMSARKMRETEARMGLVMQFSR